MRRKRDLLILLISSIILVSSINLSSIYGQVSYPVPREETMVAVWDHYFSTFDSFNPFTPNGFQWGSGWNQLCLEPLWFVETYSGEIKYWLIRSWDYADNYTKFTIHVREGARWNDGTPFTANDIAFSINLGINYSVAYWGMGFVGWDEFVDRMEIPDDYTLILYLKEPNPRLHNSFYGWPSFSIVPEHIWKDEDVFTFKNNPPVGTGPYLLYKVLPEAGMYVWVRDEDWWGTEVFGLKPEPKYMIFKGHVEQDIRISQFVRGDIDWGPLVSGAPFLDAVKTQTDNWQPLTLAPTGTLGFFVNCDPSNYPFNVTEFRRAISYCIDRETIANLWPGEAGAAPADFAWPDVPPLSSFSDADLVEQYGLKFDINEAASILDSLNFIDTNDDGWRETPDGTKISFELLVVPEDPQIMVCLVIAEDLASVGIEAVLRQAGHELISDLGLTGDYDMWLWGIYANFPSGDILQYLDALSASHYTPITERAGLDLYATHYWNPELTDIVEQLENMNPQASGADELYHDAVAMIMRDLPIIPVLERYNIWVLSTEYWAGYPQGTVLQALHMPGTLVDVACRVRSTVIPQSITYVTAYITTDVEAFTGVDGTTYGPYQSGDAAFIPKDDADRLIAEEKASLVPAEIPMIAEDVSAIRSDVVGLSNDLSEVKSDTEALKAFNNTLSSIVYASIGLNIIVLLLVVVVLVRKKN